MRDTNGPFCSARDPGAFGEVGQLSQTRGSVASSVARGGGGGDGGDDDDDDDEMLVALISVRAQLVAN